MLTVDGGRTNLGMVHRLAQTVQLAVVIAGNGMCSSGRIVNYLKAKQDDPRHNVSFVDHSCQGYTSYGYRLMAIVGAALDGTRYDIKAAVDSIGGYSAHAHQAGW